ncbi:MAG TPA: AIR synthase-related protein, partial [Erysipelothrix sp.]|nr:AIR synthase-related protein [Erysipelothrix sp.]
VEKEDQIDGTNIKEGNAIIAIPSSGVHSNGFSLIRHIFTEEELVAQKDELLKPTRIYVKEIQALMKHIKPNGLAHITGGGLIENVPRILPENTHAVIDKSKIDVLDVFHLIAKQGDIEMDEMYGTFNMGVGYVVVVDEKDVKKTLEIIEDAYVIGEIIHKEKGITL